MIYFGNPKKHEVAAGAANITIFCQKVRTLLYLRPKNNMCVYGYMKF